MKDLVWIICTNANSREEAIRQINELIERNEASLAAKEESGSASPKSLEVTLIK